MSQLDELTSRFGISDPPASWRAHWDSFVSWESEGRCKGACWRIPEGAGEVFGLADEVMQPLTKVCAAIQASTELSRLADLWHYLIYHLSGDLRDNPGIWPVPDEMFGNLAPLFPLVVLASGADHALDEFTKKGVSDEIARRTLGYAGYFVRDYHKKRGAWGLAELGWLRNFVRARLFQLGRLSFMAAAYNWPFRVYRNRLSGGVKTLCESSARYRRDGLADGTNSVFDPGAWQSVLRVEEGEVVGFPVSEEGIATKKPVTLDLSEWEQVLAPGDHMVEVHIAADNGKLTPDECRKSYQQALELFPRLYPQTKFSAFTCWSWLLDPGLSKILPPGSNIVNFQRSFHLLPVVGDHRQAYDLVFGDAFIDPITAPKTTYLQHAIADYVAAGNQMRSTAGIMIWDEVMVLVTNS